MRVSAEFAEAKAEPEKRVNVGMQIVAELLRKGRCVGRKRAVPPDDRARLAACDPRALARPARNTFLELPRGLAPAARAGRQPRDFEAI